MNFTREPLIETVITPREGCKLVVRSSKANGQEDYFVDAVEVVSFGHSFFFRSSEKPKSFLVPCSDYEILELRETRMVLKHVPTERSVKIGGGRDSAPPRQPREPHADNKSESKNEPKHEPRQEREVVAPAESDEEAPILAEGAVAPTAEQRSDRNKRDRRRRGRRGRSDRAPEAAATTDGSEPVADDSQEPASENSTDAPVDQKKIFEKPLVPISKRVLLAPPGFKPIVVPAAKVPEVEMTPESPVDHVPVSESPSEYPPEPISAPEAVSDPLDEEDEFPESLKEPKQDE